MRVAHRFYRIVSARAGSPHVDLLEIVIQHMENGSEEIRRLAIKFRDITGAVAAKMPSYFA